MTPQKVSDDELKKHMNFDDLIQRRSVLVKKQKFMTSTSIAVIVILGALSVWYVAHDSTSHTNDVQPHQRSVIVDSLAAPGPAGIDSPQNATVKPETPAIVQDETVKGEEKANKVAPMEKKSNERSSNDRDHTSADVYLQAEPVNGYAALYDYFKKNIKYPAEAVKDSVEGVLTVSFIVTESGTPEKIEVSQSLGQAFDQVAIELIRNMPEWKPAMLNGKPVKSRISLPVTFELKNVEENNNE